MSELSDAEMEHRLGRLSFETKMTRIEFFVSSERPDETRWSVVGAIDPNPVLPGRQSIALVGHLAHAHDGRWVQAVVLGLGQMPHGSMDDGFEAVTADFGGGWVEAMYDAARLTANSLAALMDVSLALPRSSPVTEIRHDPDRFDFASTVNPQPQRRRTRSAGKEVGARDTP